MKSGNPVVGQCPNCHNVLHINEGESIICPYCDQTIDSSQIETASASGGGGTSAELTMVAGLAQFAMQIENPASGMAYLENRFETTDWEDFETNLSFELEGISTVVEKNKVTNANNPDTWLLEYKSVTEILLHKFKGLDKLMAEIEAAYDPLDLTNTFSSFDRYARLAHALVERRENTYKVLESDLRFMEKFEAPKDVLSQVKEAYADLKKQYDAVAEVSKVEDIPDVEKVIKKKQKAIVDSLANEGIDAEALYLEAVEDYNRSSGVSEAFGKFRKLKGYKDSSDYIAKINSLNRFNNIVEANGKLYYAVSTKRDSVTFNVNSGEDVSEGTVYVGSTTTLYPVRNKEYDPSMPVVSGISHYITCYNGKLFYIFEGSAIKMYDFNTGVNTTLDSGRSDCYANLLKTNGNKSFLWGAGRTSFYIKKQLDTRKPVLQEKSGCFKKAPPPPKEQLNNFSLLKIDLDTGKAQEVIPEMVDIMDIYGDYIFFTQSRDIPETREDRKGRPITASVPKTFFSSYNLKTGVFEDMLSERDFLVDAVDGKVVYCKYSPVTYNMDLYVYDIAEKTSLLLEKNIYDAYHNIYNGKVLYSVGCYGRRSMFSINLDGTERTEILLNVERINWFDRNWMYVVKGYGANTMLIKISYDGKKRVIVATEVRKFIEMTAGNIYYIDTYGYLCIVRNDGKNKRRILDHCEGAKIVIDVNNVFIMREESMNNNGSVVCTSLYSVDLQGHNLKKIFYGLVDMEEIDDGQRIFFLQSQKRRYKVTTPQEKGDPVVSYTDATVKVYYSYNKQTQEIQELLVLGVPKEKTFEFKRGCFGRKKVSEHSKIEEVVEETGYNRSGKMTPGQAAAEQRQIDEIVTNAVNSATGAKPSARGTSSASGCSGK